MGREKLLLRLVWSLVLVLNGRIHPPLFLMAIAGPLDG